MVLGLINLDQNAMAYAATTLASSMMNSVFFFYYVKLYIDHYSLTEDWFQFAQVMYMLWNAINDPLFGYLQDNSNWSIFTSRKKAIYYGGPIWAVTFLLPWFQWADYSKSENNWIVGIHLIVTLCAFDAMLTFVLLAHCALSAEISTRHSDRLRLVKYQQVASLLGSSSVMTSSFVSNNMQNFLNLQLFCVFIACAAVLCLRYTGRNVNTKYENEKMSGTNESLLSKEEDAMQVSSALKLTRQILVNRNFISFVLMNFFQVFHNTFCANFLLIFADHLLPKNAVPWWVINIIYGASFILPQACILLGGTIIAKFGAYRVVMTSFFIQIFASVVVFTFGRYAYWILSLYFIVDMTIPSACFSIFNILLSDIIDEDMSIHNRKHPQSSMVFGTNALITKPANSFAPMLGVAILNRYGYEQLKDHKTSTAELNFEDVQNLQDVMFQLMCFVPIVISVCQIAVWSFYKLRNSHTTEAKHVES